MRPLLFLLLLFGLGGCAPTYFVAFSEGYNPATSYTNSLPAMVLVPGETRRAMQPPFQLALVPSPRTSILSEDPDVVRIWKPLNPDDVVRLQALVPGSTLVHCGEFPFPGWEKKADPVHRAEWRARLRRFLHPRPDDVEFRKITDEELWRTVLRSRSKGALRVVVEEDRLNFQQ